MINLLDHNEDFEFPNPEFIAHDFILLAYGDTKKTLKQDFIGTSQNKKILKILSYSEGTKNLDSIQKEFTKEIVLVIPCDFKQDGELSYILAFKDDGEYNIQHYSFREDKLQDLGQSDRLPFIYSHDQWKNTVVLQLNDVTMQHFYENGAFNSKQASFPRLDTNHTSAFVDLNGDLRPDLALMIVENNKRYVEISLSSIEMTYERVQILDIPENIGPLVFADFNGNGLIDMAFVSIEGAEYYLNVFLNQGMEHFLKENYTIPLKPNKSSKNNKDYEKDMEKKHKYAPFSIENTKAYEKIHLNPIFPGLRPIITLDSLHYASALPGGIIATDYTLSSYPDIILLMANDKNETEIRVLTNTMDKKPLFKPLPHQPNQLKGVLSASVCDFKRNNRESLIVNRIHNGKYELSFFSNDYAKDRYRLTVTVLQPNAESKNYSSTAPGITCRYYIEEINTTRISCNSTQSGFPHLQRPLCLLGLGSISYNGDILSLGGPRTSNSAYYNSVMVVKNKILPNSDLVLKPHDHGLKVELYLKIGKHVKNIIIVFVIVLICNLILIYYSYFQEKKKLRLKKKKQDDAFNYAVL